MRHFKIKIGAVIILLTGSYFLNVSHRFVMDRDGVTLYNFLLYFVAQISWGYFMGQHLLKFKE